MNFKKSFLKIILVVSLIFCFYTPVYSESFDYTLLSPLPGTTVGSGKTATFQSYLPGMFKLAIGISAVLAFVMITYGGILYATTDAIGGKEEGRGYITNAVYGLVLVIGAWAILYTINPRMLEFDLNLPIPNLATTSSSVYSTTGNKLPGYNLSRAEVAQDKSIRDSLWNSSASGGKIHVNSTGPCANGETVGCTNLVGLPTTAISGLKNLNNACNCEILITGGTEGGHKTHGPQQPNVDIAILGPVTNYIISNGGTPKQTSLGPLYTVNVGGKSTTFLKESNPPHWHVVF